MNHYLKDQSKFKLVAKSIDEIFGKEFSLPEKSLLNKGFEIHWIESEAWQLEDFYTFVTTLSKSVKAQWWATAVLKPNPESYFFEHFDAYPVVLGSSFTSDDDYISALSADPKDSPADAIAYNYDIVFVTDSSNQWGIYCDRELEIGMIVCRQEISSFLDSIYPFPKYENISDALRNLHSYDVDGVAANNKISAYDKLLEIYGGGKKKGQNGCRAR